VELLDDLVTDGSGRDKTIGFASYGGYWHASRRAARHLHAPRWQIAEAPLVVSRALTETVFIRDAAEVEGRFEALASWWEEDTLVISSTTEVVMHPAYQGIIGLGLQAVPLILERLRREPAQWFWALHHITGYNVAPDNSTVDEAARAWLSWGSERGYLANEDV
jgi:hypothetical protein